MMPSVSEDVLRGLFQSLEGSDVLIMAPTGRNAGKQQSFGFTSPPVRQQPPIFGLCRVAFVKSKPPLQLSRPGLSDFGVVLLVIEQSRT